MFAKIQINPIKTKYEYIPIETKKHAIRVHMGNSSTKEVGGQGHHV
jgi:hypothetical protein